MLHSSYISECSSHSVSGSRTLKCRCRRRSQPSWVRDAGRGAFSAVDHLQCSSDFIHLSEWRVVMLSVFCVCVQRSAGWSWSQRSCVNSTLRCYRTLCYRTCTGTWRTSGNTHTSNDAMMSPPDTNVFIISLRVVLCVSVCVCTDRSAVWVWLWLKTSSLNWTLKEKRL